MVNNLECLQMFIENLYIFKWLLKYLAYIYWVFVFLITGYKSVGIVYILWVQILYPICTSHFLFLYNAFLRVAVFHLCKI